jgi:hypothetical protein
MWNLKESNTQKKEEKRGSRGMEGEEIIKYCIRILFFKVFISIY